MELLKQPLGHPMSLSDQVITLVCAIGRKFVDIPVETIKSYQGRLLDYFHENCFDIVNEIQTGKVLTDALRDKILEAADTFGKANHG